MSRVTYRFESKLDETNAQLIVLQSSVLNESQKCITQQDLTPQFTYTEFTKSPEKAKPGSIEVLGRIQTAKGTKKVVVMYTHYYYGKTSIGLVPKTLLKDTQAQRDIWFQQCLARIAKISGLKSVSFAYYHGSVQQDVYYDSIEKFAQNNQAIRVYVDHPLTEQETYVVEEPEEEDPLPYDYHYLKWFHDQFREMMMSASSGFNAGKFLKAVIKQYEAETRFDYPYKEDGFSEDEDRLSEIPESEAEVEDADQERQIQPVESYANGLREYTKAHPPLGWEEFFEIQCDHQYGTLLDISNFLIKEVEAGHTIFPPIEKIYFSFEQIKPKDVKVVIIGQDPYHDEGQAMGLAFSVSEGIALPPSLKNIYAELETEGFTVDWESGDLTRWCQQGVLMINTALTVRAHTPASHSNKWLEGFTPALMAWLNLNLSPSVIILWGAHAQKFESAFGNKHKILKSPHPSPLSAGKGFFGSGCFVNANNILTKLRRGPVDWSLGPVGEN